MSNLFMKGTDSHEIKVTIETCYLPEQSQPEHDRYVFAYTISIANAGTSAARLLRRHWIITDANNKIREVHGDGVVGEQPRLLPGEIYQYTSGACLETPIGCMEGNYDMIADDGFEFKASIPAFTLSMPKILH